MDNIDKIIYYAETGKYLNQPFAPDEPTEIYSAIAALRIGSEYYFLNWYMNMKEFQRSKLTRSNSVPKTDEKEREMTIRVIDGTEGNTAL